MSARYRPTYVALWEEHGDGEDIDIWTQMVGSKMFPEERIYQNTRLMIRAGLHGKYVEVHTPTNGWLQHLKSALAKTFDVSAVSLRTRYGGKLVDLADVPTSHLYALGLVDVYDRQGRQKLEHPTKWEVPAEFAIDKARHRQTWYDNVAAEVSQKVAAQLEGKTKDQLLVALAENGEVYNTIASMLSNDSLYASIGETMKEFRRIHNVEVKREPLPELCEAMAKQVLLKIRAAMHAGRDTIKRYHADKQVQDMRERGISSKVENFLEDGKKERFVPRKSELLKRFRTDADLYKDYIDMAFRDLGLQKCMQALVRRGPAFVGKKKKGKFGIRVKKTKYQKRKEKRKKEKKENKSKEDEDRYGRGYHYYYYGPDHHSHRRRRPRVHVYSQTLKGKARFPGNAMPTLIPLETEAREMPELVALETKARREMPRLVPIETKARREMPELVPLETKARREMPRLVPIETKARREMPRLVPIETKARREMPKLVHIETKARGREMPELVPIETKARREMPKLVPIKTEAKKMPKLVPLKQEMMLMSEDIDEFEGGLASFNDESHEFLASAVNSTDESFSNFPSIESTRRKVLGNSNV